jgi:hypothetical protein
MLPTVLACFPTFSMNSLCNSLCLHTAKNAGFHGQFYRSWTVGRWELAGSSSFFVVTMTGAGLCFPNSDTARNADRLAVYSENPGTIYPGLLSGLGHLSESRVHYI